ncbi:uncharacterized protein DUF3800 [Nitrosomonas nitrosa]|uniref:DUF3800 domain-containing protein n=1 Tax=Nitrosomonas nitrosa TaxID=52442 RepID=UPI000D312988|nr:DUF3800 domain-containing protein [Nitrosomonas nitrosa]PTQ94716.1 uncharacterized protein DUF3800 [Nitrosomonas nitrosa]
MSEIFNIYCDESCHLENDHYRFMVLGGLWCPTEKTREIAVRIREIKHKHQIPHCRELKWSKVSAAKLDLYLDLIDYFFDDDDLNFRVLVADKSILDHGAFNQSHDEWYYKMYFDMLKVIFDPECRYRIYLDIKDTQGGEKVRRLHRVLCNSQYDFSQKIIERVQIVESHHVEQLQLTDLLIGAISYLHNQPGSSEAKQTMIERIKQRSHYSLRQQTLYREKKFNLFIWYGQGGRH